MAQRGKEEHVRTSQAFCWEGVRQLRKVGMLEGTFYVKPEILVLTLFSQENIPFTKTIRCALVRGSTASLKMLCCGCPLQIWIGGEWGLREMK